MIADFMHSIAEAFKEGGWGMWPILAILIVSIGLIIIGVVAMLVSIGISLLTERVAYRPLRRAPRLVPLITAIGAGIAVAYTGSAALATVSEQPDLFGPRFGTWHR